MPKTDHLPLVIADYMADTAHLSTAEHGAYLLLLMTAWMRGGPLPDDDAQLARIARASSREWKTLRASLAPFFHVADGEWRQKRLLMELAKAIEAASVAGAKASTAAAVRWGKEGESPPGNAPSIATSNAPSNASSNASSNAPGNATSNAQAPPQAMPMRGRAPVCAVEVEVASKKRLDKQKETLIPQDFAISERVATWADRKGYAREYLDAVLEIFGGRNRANGKTYCDWDQAFMNAAREDWYGLRAQKNGGSGREKRASNMDRLTGNHGRDIEGAAERVGGGTVRALPGGLWQPGELDVGGRKSGPGKGHVG